VVAVVVLVFIGVAVMSIDVASSVAVSVAVAGSVALKVLPVVVLLGCKEGWRRVEEAERGKTVCSYFNVNSRRHRLYDEVHEQLRCGGVFYLQLDETKMSLSLEGVSSSLVDKNVSIHCPLLCPRW